MNFHGCSAMFPLLQIFFVVSIILEGVYVTSSQICEDPPVECPGGVFIRYTFWQKDNHTANTGSYCGYRGLSISCGEVQQGGRALISISNHSYYVQNINYFLRTGRLRVVDVDIGIHKCPKPRHNISLNSTPFSYYKSFWMILYSNCTNYPEDAKQHLPCLDHVYGNFTRRSFLFKKDDEILKGGFNWYENCEETVQIPYYSNTRDSGYKGSWKLGFDLVWSTPDNIEQCERSGGKSLFNETTRAYHCFCRDGNGNPVVFQSVCPHEGIPLQLKIVVGVCYGVGASLLVFFLNYKSFLSSSCYLAFLRWRNKLRNPSNCWG